MSLRALVSRLRGTDDWSTKPWPTAALAGDRLVVDGRLVAALELAPLNLELMAHDERAMVLEGLAAFYDAVPGPFQLLSVPTRRDATEHLSAIEPSIGRRAERVFRPYAAAYRGMSDAAKRPSRKTVLVLGGGSDAELKRSLDLLVRIAEERGFGAHPVEADVLGALWVTIARPGSSYRIRASVAEGPTLLTTLTLARNWPAEIPAAWLAGVLGVDGLAAVSMRVRPLSRADAMTFMTARLRVVRAADRLAAERGEVSDVERERVAATATSARRAVAAGSNRIYIVETLLLLEGGDRSMLNERIEQIGLEARSIGTSVSTTTLRIAPAWTACLPGGAPSGIGERNLDSESLTAALLHAASDLYERCGHLYGIARTTGAPIVLDRFAHASHNAIVLGQTGTGKTMFTGAEMARCYMRGIRVVAIDPLGDYRRLTRALGGTYFELGATGSLNPLAMTGPMNEAAFMAKLASLVRLVGAMVGGVSRQERAVVERALRVTYESAGIGPDPGTHSTAAPTLAEFARHLAESRDGHSLAGRLERWSSGSLAPMFAGRHGLPVDVPFLVIGLSAIRDPEVRDVGQLAALGAVWDAVRADLAPKLIVVDEAWKVMRQSSGAEFVEELARSARHYHAGLQLATQDITEFLRSEYGESVIKQCDIRVLLGQTPEGVDALARYFDLSMIERRSLLHARPGEGLIFVGRSHIAFEAKVSNREYEWLTTRPADLVGASPLRYDAPNTS